MSRRAQAPKRLILPDPVYGSETLSKFMNMVMESGKKSVAERIVYGAIDQISDRRKMPADNAVEVLEQALENFKPMVEVKSRRVGGAHLDRHLVGRATDPAGLHLDHRLHVLQRLLENLDSVVGRHLAAIRDLVDRTVDDALRDRLLAAFHDHVHELRQRLAAVDRIGENEALGRLGTSGHGTTWPKKRS